MFLNCTALESVSLPRDLKTMSASAFRGCTSLSEIVIPDNVETIGNNAFYNCKALYEVTLPKSVTSIGTSAFDINSSETNEKINTVNYGGNAIEWDELVSNGISTGNEPLLNADIKYTIIDASEIAVVSDLGSYEYTGSEIKPEPTVKVGNKTLVKGTDYRLSYNNNMYISDYAECIITFIGSYTGKKTVFFTISASVLSIRLGDNVYGSLDTDSCVLTISGSGNMYDYTVYNPFYNLDEYIEEVVINDGVTSIGSMVFYSCSHLTMVDMPDSIKSIGRSAFSDCIALNDINISKGVERIGEYAFDLCESLSSIYYNGVKAEWAKVDGADEMDYNYEVIYAIGNMRNTTISGYELSYAYTGSRITPEITVKWSNGEELEKDVDYIVSYGPNTNAGEGKITVTGINDYTGSKDAYFSIFESEYTVTYSGSPIVYNFGDEPFVDIYDITLRCADGTEFTGPDIGNIGVLDDGWSDFTAGSTVEVWCSAWNPALAEHGINTDGTATLLNLPIQKRVFTQDDLIDMSITTFDGEDLDYIGSPYWKCFADKMYTGDEVEFAFDIITFSEDYGLSAEYDFTCTYRDNILPGTGYVVIDFGKYNTNIGGTIEIPFNIVGTSLGDITVIGSNEDYEYTGSYIRPAVKVSRDGVILTKDTDYTVEFRNNVDAGIADIIITGINKYSGEYNAYFRIVPKSSDDVYISPIGDVVFTGKEQKPEIEIIDEDR